MTSVFLLAAALAALPQGSFVYDGVRYAGTNALTGVATRAEAPKGGVRRTVTTGLTPDGRLRVTCARDDYERFPATEVVYWFENVSDGPAAVLEKICAADGLIPGVDANEALLRHGILEHHTGKNHTQYLDALRPGASLTLGPPEDEGRSCWHAMPYFRVFDARGGWAIALGWTGLWRATFSGTEKGARIEAGLARCDMRLFAGEKVRSPRMTYLRFEGDETAAANAWRAWYFAHILPRDRDGGPLKPRYCGFATAHPADPNGATGEFCLETEATQLAYIRRARREGFDFDVWWVDAGWYPHAVRDAKGEMKEHWWFVGNWNPDPVRFPRGLGAIAEEVGTDRNKDFLLWYEPERVQADGSVFDRRRDLLLDGGGHLCPFTQSRPITCVNLAKDEAVRILTETIVASLKTNGVTIYRQDCNFSPTRNIRAEEARQGAHRLGVVENLYIQGLYRFIDGLKAAIPGLLFDNCASGGRRNDLEMMRRGVPLHTSDYGGLRFEEKQRYRDLLFQWLPYFKDFLTFTHKSIPKNTFYIGACGFAAFGWHTLYRPDFYDSVADHEIVRVWRDCAPYFVGTDYYLLAGGDGHADGWTSFQFHRASDSSGFFNAIRHPENREGVRFLRLHGLDAAATYAVRDCRSERSVTRTGRELMARGFRVDLPPHEATCFRYEKTAK